MSRSRRKKKQSSGDKAEIDLTPMLDVVFIMLIFFIVTASFVKEKAINVNVPEDNENVPETKNASILVQIDANNEIYVDGRRVDVRSIRSLVAQKHAESPQAPLIIRAHEESTAETYVQVSDAAREAKVYAISLVPFSGRL